MGGYDCSLHRCARAGSTYCESFGWHVICQRESTTECERQRTSNQRSFKSQRQTFRYIIAEREHCFWRARAGVKVKLGGRGGGLVLMCAGGNESSTGERSCTTERKAPRTRRDRSPGRLADLCRRPTSQSCLQKNSHLFTSSALNHYIPLHFCHLHYNVCYE